MANGKYSKRDARAASVQQAVESSRDDLPIKPAAVRCRSCRRADRPCFVEMGGFVFCDECIEAAAQIVAESKASR